MLKRYDLPTSDFLTMLPEIYLFSKWDLGKAQPEAHKVAFRLGYAEHFMQ